MMDIFKLIERIGAGVGLHRRVEDRFRIRGSVEAEFRNARGELTSRSITHNLRTSAGADYWNKQLFGAASNSAIAKNIAITTDTGTPLAGDTTLASEETLNGLVRRVADTNTYNTPTATTTLVITYTYTGSTAKVIAKAGLFDATPSGGNLVLETLLASTGTVNANGDTIKITWTINW